MSDVTRLLREVHTRRVALFAYAAMHDRHAELEQLYLGLGRFDMADAARANAEIALAAWRVEDDDPNPATEVDAVEVVAALSEAMTLLAEART